MAQQEEGWPLGLQPLNVRAGQVRNRGFNGSLSFNTLITGSPSSSTDSSSDLDTEVSIFSYKLNLAPFYIEYSLHPKLENSRCKFGWLRIQLVMEPPYLLRGDSTYFYYVYIKI